MEDNKIKNAVKVKYSRIAKQRQQEDYSSCECGCGSLARTEAKGYSREELECIPEEAARIGLGCGNPIAIAELGVGETVLDLGSGAGRDAFLAANQVGPKGRIIGVDMTREMIDKASTIARDSGYDNVEFRLGEIEKLPVDDSSVDTIISNCVVNLSPDKSEVFREAYRVLRPGGKLVLSDVVAERPIPPEMRNDLEAWACCIAGALEQDEYLGKIREAGFGDVQVVAEREFYAEDKANNEMVKLLSITLRACKPC